MGKKKEKVTYIDDGRTLADMTEVHGGFGSSKESFGYSRSRLKDIWNTYWTATKMMFLPTMAIVGALLVLYLIMALIFWLA